MRLQLRLALVLALFVSSTASYFAKHFLHGYRQQRQHSGRRMSSTTASETHVCSLDSLVGRAGQYAVQAEGFFGTLEAELETLAGIIEMHESDYLKYGPMKQRYENLGRECSPDCAAEDSFWKDAASKSAEQIKERQTGYWDITSPSRPCDLYYPAWSEHYAFDWRAAADQELPPTPAALGLLRPRESNNLTVLCADEGFDQCKGNPNTSCPSYCVWPEMFNNSIIFYESLLTQNIIIPATKILSTHADSAFIWYWVGADSGAFRPVPPFNVMIGPGVTAGLAVGSDFTCPVTFCGPIMNPSKAIAWTSLLTDPYGNLMVTAARPIYIAGKWIGAIMTDVMLETTSALVEQFRATENSHTVLCDAKGAIIGASAPTYSFLFCPAHPACNNGSTFSIGQSWDESSASAGSVLGPQLVGANQEFFAAGGPLMMEIAEQAIGLKKTSGYYIVWNSLNNAALFGMRVLIIVPEADIDKADGAKVEPQVVPLFKHQTDASVLLSNDGVLPWYWKASSSGDSVHVWPEQGVLQKGEKVTVALQRAVTNVSLEVTFSASGSYATCILPVKVFITMNCENGEYRKGPVGSDSCMLCPSGHKCLGNVLSVCSKGSAQPAMGQATCQPCQFGRYQDEEGMSACKECPPGTTAEVSGGDSCVNCSVGKYAEIPGSTSCNACPNGKYQQNAGAKQCLPCDAVLAGSTSTQSSVSAEACYCKKGTYASSADGICETCPMLQTTESEGAMSLEACYLDSSFYVFAIVGLCTLTLLAILLGAILIFRSCLRGIEEVQRRDIIRGCVEHSSSLAFPMVLIPFERFITIGRLISYEDALRKHMLRVLATMEEVREFKKRGNAIVFISHQWLCWTEPDPNHEHYNAIVSAVAAIAQQRELKTNRCFVWVDYHSVPQETKQLQAMAVRTLPYFASISSMFVIVAPCAHHSDTHEECNFKTYQQRLWCRAELFSFFCRRGTDDMYKVEDTSNGECHPVRVDEEEISDAFFVFEGQSSCCTLRHADMPTCDKQVLRDVFLGLYADVLCQHKGFTFYNRASQSEEKTRIVRILRHIQSHRDRFFPRTFQAFFDKDRASPSPLSIVGTSSLKSISSSGSSSKCRRKEGRNSSKALVLPLFGNLIASLEAMVRENSEGLLMTSQEPAVRGPSEILPLDIVEKKLVYL